MGRFASGFGIERFQSLWAGQQDSDPKVDKNVHLALHLLSDSFQLHYTQPDRPISIYLSIHLLLSWAQHCSPPAHANVSKEEREEWIEYRDEFFVWPNLLLPLWCLSVSFCYLFFPNPPSVINPPPGSAERIIDFSRETIII